MSFSLSWLSPQFSSKSVIALSLFFSCSLTYLRSPLFSVINNKLSLINELDDIDGGEFDSANPYETGDSVDGGTFNPWNTGDVADGGSFTRTNVHYITELYS